MQPKDLLRHAPLVRVQDALTRYNAIRNTNFTMTSPVSPMTFAEIVHLMDQDAFHGLPSGLQGSTTRLLQGGWGLADRAKPTNADHLAKPSSYLGRQNISAFWTGAFAMLDVLDNRGDEDVWKAMSKFIKVLRLLNVEMNARELERLAGGTPDMTVADKMGARLAQLYCDAVEADAIVYQNKFKQDLDGYRQREEESSWEDDGKDDGKEGGEESDLPLGCLGMSSNCPVRGLPPKLYRWQSFRPKEGINVDADGDKGLPTAMNGKVAYAMGAISVDYLIEIDRDKLILLIGVEQVKEGFYSISGSRNAGWEFKLWVSVPQGAISNIWGKGSAPQKHKPKGI